MAVLQPKNQSENESQSGKELTCQTNNSLFIRGSSHSFEIAAMVHDCDDAVITIGSSGCVMSWNAASEVLFGYTTKEAIGKHVDFLVAAERRGLFEGLIQRLKHGETVPTIETQFLPKRAEPVNVLLNLTGLYEPDSRECLGTSIIVKDARKREKSLELMATAIEEQLVTKASMMKACILDIVSHELRTPLAQIIGMNELLLSSALSEDQEHLSKSVEEAAVHLLNVVNEFITMAQIESGQVCINNEPLVIAEVVQKCVSEFEQAAHQKGLQIDFTVSQDIDSPLWVDGRWLKAALRRFIANALKFTDNGRITVSARVQSVVDGTERIRFAVTDTGTGIPDEIGRNVFLPFTKADASSTRKYDGAGLGLAIAKGLVELMGGELNYESLPGQGTTVWCEIPCILEAPASSQIA